MKSMTPFQLVVTGAFILLTIGGIGVFAAFGGLSGGSSVGTVVIWGTASSDTINPILQTLRDQDKSFQNVTYVPDSAASYESDLVDAIAAGRGPDLFLMTQDELGAFADKVLAIPYSAVSQSTYINSYVDEANLFLTGQGTLALPFMVDPLVMYWNRDLLASAGVAQPPTQWNDFLALAPKITAIDGSQNISRSAVALGEWQNVDHAKEILSTLFMQAGDPITSRDAQGNVVSVFGATPQSAPENPAESALRFYTEFANPAKTTYSWNRSLPSSEQAFVAGDLAIYFGFASEYQDIAKRNPNLHFSVAALPQLSNSGAITFGSLTGLAIPRGARNSSGALTIAEKLSSQAAGQLFAQAGLPSVRRDVAVNASASAALQTFEQSALIARGWFDPSPSATDSIFKTMIESVTTGKAEPAQAAAEAAQEMQGLFKQ